MKITRFVLVMLAAAMLSACGDARFEKMPGMYSDMIPAELQGTYEVRGKDFKSVQSDSLVIRISNNDIVFTTANSKSTWAIHQSFQFSRLNQYYVIGTADKTIHALWNIAIIENTENGLKIYPVSEPKISLEPESPMQRYMPFKDMMLQHEPIGNMPSKVDGSSISTPDMSNGPDQVRYYSPNDEQLINYFERELKDKEYYLLRKQSEKEGRTKEPKKGRR